MVVEEYYLNYLLYTVLENLELNVIISCAILPDSRGKTDTFLATLAPQIARMFSAS